MVEDGYQLKTCEICHELDLKDSALRSANSERDREIEKLVKRLGIEKLPQALESYANYCESCEKIGMGKPKFENYMKELTEHRKREIQRQTDNQVKDIKGEKAKRIKYYSRFLRFDLFGFSNRDKCKAYRLSIMDGKQDVRLSSHLEECENCQDWQYTFNETDAFTHNRLLVDIDGHPFFTEQEDKEIKEFYNPQEDKLEQWESQKRQTELPKQQVNKALKQEYHLD